jgi:hypothetical protein
MLGRKIIERQQIGAILGPAFHRAVVFHAVSLDEEIEGIVRRGLGSGHPDVLQMRLGLRLGSVAQIG